MKHTPAPWHTANNPMTTVLATYKAAYKVRKALTPSKHVSGEEWATCVPAKPFTDWLYVTQEKPNKQAIGRGQSDQIELTLIAETQILQIKAGNTRAEFKCLDAREFPPSTPVDGQE